MVVPLSSKQLFMGSIPIKPEKEEMLKKNSKLQVYNQRSLGLKGPTLNYKLIPCPTENNKDLYYLVINDSYGSNKLINFKDYLNSKNKHNKNSINLLTLVDKTTIKTNILLNKSKAKFSNQYSGLQFRISGRLNGAQRARKMQVNHGRISSQTFNTSLQLNKKQIYTKWGTWGSSVFVSKSC